MLLFLFGQLFLRQTRSEPYPTFLLPAGASLYRTDSDGIVFNRDMYYAVGPDGTQTSVRLFSLLRELGKPAALRIPRDNFGLREPGPRASDIRLGPIRIPRPMGVTTEEELEFTKAWMRERLEELSGHPVVSIRVVRRKYRYRPFDNAPEEEIVRTVSDRTLPLVSDTP